MNIPDPPLVEDDPPQELSRRMKQIEQFLLENKDILEQIKAEEKTYRGLATDDGDKPISLPQESIQHIKELMRAVRYHNEQSEGLLTVTKQYKVQRLLTITFLNQFYGDKIAADRCYGQGNINQALEATRVLAVPTPMFDQRLQIQSKYGQLIENAKKFRQIPVDELQQCGRQVVEINKLVTDYNYSLKLRFLLYHAHLNDSGYYQQQVESVLNSVGVSDELTQELLQNPLSTSEAQQMEWQLSRQLTDEFMQQTDFESKLKDAAAEALQKMQLYIVFHYKFYQFEDKSAKNLKHDLFKSDLMRTLSGNYLDILKTAKRYSHQKSIKLQLNAVKNRKKFEKLDGFVVLERIALVVRGQVEAFLRYLECHEQYNQKQTVNNAVQLVRRFAKPDFLRFNLTQKVAVLGKDLVGRMKFVTDNAEGIVAMAELLGAVGL